MNKGDICVQEFVRVADFLLKSGKVRIHRGYILAPRNVIDRLLAKNQYETIETKLQYWKKLHWIHKTGINRRSSASDGEN